MLHLELLLQIFGLREGMNDDPLPEVLQQVIPYDSLTRTLSHIDAYTDYW